MRPGRFQRRPAAPEPPRPATSPATLTTAGQLRPKLAMPVATNDRDRRALAASLAVLAAEDVAAQPESVKAAVRASLRARLRARGTTIARAYAAHTAALSGMPHDEDAAAAWRTAIVAAASLLRPARLS